MSDAEHQDWRQLSAKKRNDLKEAYGSKLPRLANRDALLKSFRSFSNINKRDVALISGKLDPGIDKLTAFVNAVTKVSRCSPATNLLWEAIYAIVEVG